MLLYFQYNNILIIKMWIYRLFQLVFTFRDQILFQMQPRAQCAQMLWKKPLGLEWTGSAEVSRTRCDWKSAALKHFFFSIISQAPNSQLDFYPAVNQMFQRIDALSKAVKNGKETLIFLNLKINYFSKKFRSFKSARFLYTHPTGRHCLLGIILRGYKTASLFS